MKKILSLISLALLAAVLNGCMASSSSPVGVNCDFSKEKPISEMPVDCQGR
ncbi:hypothetical protein [Polynucleobacter sp.]|uniref:hypothetical protein n=1 Tax=Polynucleobacter sp. TaxID=2029855 RepID=UPI003019D66F